jgi:hypothetical protein
MTRAKQAKKRADDQASKAEAQAREERLRTNQGTPDDLDYKASELASEASLLGEILANRDAGATPEQVADPQFYSVGQTLRKTIRQLLDIEGRLRIKAQRLRARQEKSRKKEAQP